MLVGTLTHGNSIANYQGPVHQLVKGGISLEVLHVRYIPQVDRDLDLDNIVVISQRFFKNHSKKITDFLILSGKTIYISNSGIIDQSIGPGRDHKRFVAQIFDKQVSEIECLFKPEVEDEKEHVFPFYHM
jgi:hypothetical protein